METTEQTVESLMGQLIRQDQPEPEDETLDAGEVEAEEEPEAASGDEEHAETDAETESDAGQKQPEVFTVKVNGEEVQVTLEDLKRGYSGNAYVQKGMQEAAAKRKEADAIAQALQSERQQFLEAVQKLQAEGVAARPAEPDPALLERDPIGYMRAKANYDAQMRQYLEQQQKIQQVSQQQKALQDQQLRAYVAEQAERLKTAIPEFADPQKAREVQQRLIKAGSEYGFSNDELMGLMDARAVQVLHDAAQWRALKSGQAAAKKPQQTAPKVVKPAARRDEPATLARARQLQAAKKSGKPIDFAELLLNRQ